MTFFTIDTLDYLLMASFPGSEVNATVPFNQDISICPKYTSERWIHDHFMTKKQWL